MDRRAWAVLKFETLRVVSILLNQNAKHQICFFRHKSTANQARQFDCPMARTQCVAATALRVFLK